MDDANVDWSQYEAAIVGTTWDYTRRPAEFLSAIHSIAAKTQVLNSPQVIEWNMQKQYLQDLQNAGCATIPTKWFGQLSEEQCREAFDDFACDTIVVKPQIGAGAWRQVKLARQDPWPELSKLPVGPAMVQPFQEKVVSEGEYSFLFFGRQYSHAVLKKPALGDYRIQSAYGGQDQPYCPTDSELQAAHSVLTYVDHDLLYARVDMIRSSSGQLLLIELEVIEPYLYPLHAPQMGHLFAETYRKLQNV